MKRRATGAARAAQLDAMAASLMRVRSGERFADVRERQAIAADYRRRAAAIRQRLPSAPDPEPPF